MSKKRQIQRSGTVKQGETIAAHNQAEAEQKPQLAPVAVLTITYLPPLDQIGNIQVAFPGKITGDAALHILRRAEEFLIRSSAKAAEQNLAKVAQGGSAPA